MFDFIEDTYDSDQIIDDLMSELLFSEMEDPEFNQAFDYVLYHHRKYGLNKYWIDQSIMAFGTNAEANTIVLFMLRDNETQLSNGLPSISTDFS